MPVLRITERIWLRAFGISPKFLAMLRTLDALSRYVQLSSGVKDIEQYLLK